MRRFAIKAEIGDPRAEAFVFAAQKTMYRGRRIAVGDESFLFASDALRRTGLDLDLRSDAVRDAAWSSSVQHHSAPDLLASAVRATDRLVPDRRSAHYDEVLINNIYDVRAALVGRLAARARNAGDRQTYQNILANRYPQERREALRRLQDDAQAIR